MGLGQMKRLFILLTVIVIAGTGCGDSNADNTQGLSQSDRFGNNRMGLRAGSVIPLFPVEIRWEVDSRVVADYEIELCGTDRHNGCVTLAQVRCRDKFTCDVNQSNAHDDSERDPHFFNRARVTDSGNGFPISISLNEDPNFHSNGDITNAQIPLAVKVVGWIHGVLFILYVMAAYQIFYERRDYKKMALAVFAGLMPFGPFVFDSITWSGSESPIPHVPRSNDQSPIVPNFTSVEA